MKLEQEKSELKDATSDLKHTKEMLKNQIDENEDLKIKIKIAKKTTEIKELKEDIADELAKKNIEQKEMLMNKIEENCQLREESKKFNQVKEAHKEVTKKLEEQKNLLKEMKTKSDAFDNLSAAIQYFRKRNKKMRMQCKSLTNQYKTLRNDPVRHGICPTNYTARFSG